MRWLIEYAHALPRRGTVLTQSLTNVSMATASITSVTDYLHLHVPSTCICQLHTG